MSPADNEGVHRRDGFLGCLQGRHASVKGAVYVAFTSLHGPYRINL